MLLRNIKCNSEAAVAAVQSVVHESRRPASAGSGRAGGNAASVASGGGGGGGGPATIDSILRLVGDNPGSTTCGYFTLKRIWVALSACVSDTMLKAKGVCIPGFATLSFRKVTAFRGNWGMKLELHPSFHLHPLFSRTYDVSTGGGSSLAAAAAGSVSSAQLNTSAMAIKAGVSKDACVNALKDVWRRLGDVAYRGGAVSVDLGVARVAIRGGRCDVAWNASFLAQMDRYCANLNNKALRRVCALYFHICLCFFFFFFFFFFWPGTHHHTTERPHKRAAHRVRRKHPCPAGRRPDNRQRRSS